MLTIHIFTVVVGCIFVILFYCILKIQSILSVPLKTCEIFDTLLTNVGQRPGFFLRQRVYLVGLVATDQIEADKVFSNIGDVFYATCHFWVSHMGQVLRQARKTREVLDPCLLKAGFLVVSTVSATKHSPMKSNLSLSVYSSEQFHRIIIKLKRETGV